MQILRILSMIWRHGGEMKLLPDGEINLSNHQNVPREVLEAVQPVFEDIKKWFFSWKDAKAVDITMWKALAVYCGWQRNDQISNWLESDETSMILLHDWTVELAKNGWQNVYDDYRKYENKKTHEMGREFYNRAVEFKNRKVSS